MDILTNASRMILIGMASCALIYSAPSFVSAAAAMAFLITFAITSMEPLDVVPCVLLTFLLLGVLCRLCTVGM